MYLQLAIVPLVFAQKSALPEVPEPAWDSLSAVQTACINDHKLHAVGRWHDLAYETVCITATMLIF